MKKIIEYEDTMGTRFKTEEEALRSDDMIYIQSVANDCFDGGRFVVGDFINILRKNKVIRETFFKLLNEKDEEGII